MDLAHLAQSCAPLVDLRTTNAIVQVESSFNPHAIGVVRGTLVRQPRSKAEAIATARQLQADGHDFSVGLAQINVRNWQRLGLTLQTAFDPCANLRAMQAVLTECFERASKRAADKQRATRKALSCYYSGNFETGFADGYVRRIELAASGQAKGGAAIGE